MLLKTYCKTSRLLSRKMLAQDLTAKSMQERSELAASSQKTSKDISNWPKSTRKTKLLFTKSLLKVAVLLVIPQPQFLERAAKSLSHKICKVALRVSQTSWQTHKASFMTLCITQRKASSSSMMEFNCQKRKEECSTFLTSLKRQRL